MIKTGEDKENIYYLDSFNGIPMRFYKNKLTGEVMLNSDDMAKSLGFDSIDSLIQSNENLANIYLDGMNNGLIKEIKGNQK